MREGQGRAEGAESAFCPCREFPGSVPLCCSGSPCWVHAGGWGAGGLRPEAGLCAACCPNSTQPCRPPSSSRGSEEPWGSRASSPSLGGPVALRSPLPLSFPPLFTSLSPSLRHSLSILLDTEMKNSHFHPPPPSFPELEI